MKAYTQEEVLDKTLGPRGTREREEYEEQVQEYLGRVLPSLSRTFRNAKNED